MDKFTVLMPLYNGDIAAAFSEALNSIIINQTRKPDQIVLVVDGPINETLEQELSKWVDHLDIIRIPNNIGLSNALNHGVNFCSNELIFRMDSDDVALPTRFEKQMEFFRCNPQADMCSTWVKHYDGDMEKYIGDRKVPNDPDANAQYGMTRTPVNHVSLAFRKSSLSNAGGYPDTRLPFEDWWICLRVLKAGGTIHNIPEYLVNVRASPSFYERRSGLSYAKMEFTALHQMYVEGILPFKWCIVNLATRIPLRLIPKKWLSKFYETVIRKFF